MVLGQMCTGHTTQAGTTLHVCIITVAAQPLVQLLTRAISQAELYMKPHMLHLPLYASALLYCCM